MAAKAFSVHLNWGILTQFARAFMELSQLNGPWLAFSQNKQDWKTDY